MLLLFFTVWAIVIALNEMIFAGDPFTADSIMSSLPETAALSVILSAAVFLAKSRIKQALESGRAIDRNFVAELAPEVGHELNEIRRGLNDGEEYETAMWYADLLGDRTDLSEDDLQRLQLLFEQIYSSVTEGRAKEDPDFALMLQETASFGIDPAEMFAAIQSFTEGFEEDEESGDKDEEAERIAAEKEQQNKEWKAEEAERNIDSILNTLAAPVEHESFRQNAKETVRNPRVLAGNSEIKAIESADINKITAEREAENRRRQQRLMVLNKAVSAENTAVAKQPVRSRAEGQNTYTAAKTGNVSQERAATNGTSSSAQNNVAAVNTPVQSSSKDRAQAQSAVNMNNAERDTVVDRVPERRSVNNNGADGLALKRVQSESSPVNRAVSAAAVVRADFKESADYDVADEKDSDAGVDRIINNSVYVDTVMERANVVKPEPKILNVERSVTLRESLIDTSGLKRYRPQAARGADGPDISGLRKVSRTHHPERITSNAFMNNTMSAFMTKPKAAAAKKAAENGSTIIKSIGSEGAHRSKSRTPVRSSVISRDTFAPHYTYNKATDEKNRVVSMKSLSPEERKNLLQQRRKKQASDSTGDQSPDQSSQ